MKLFDFFGAKDFDETARTIYTAVVNQARQPEFYLNHGVPDTPDGRFDMILVHAFLVLRRLKRDHDKTARLSQAVFDLMFADIDQNLREMGVGDMGVGKRVKAMAKAFYGRAAAYEKGLASGGAALGQALERNLYRKTSPDPAQTAAVVEYMRAEARRLDETHIDSLTAGNLMFGPPPARLDSDRLDSDRLDSDRLDSNRQEEAE